MIAFFRFYVSFCREIHRIFSLYIIYIEKNEPNIWLFEIKNVLLQSITPKG